MDYVLQYYNIAFVALSALSYQLLELVTCRPRFAGVVHLVHCSVYNLDKMDFSLSALHSHDDRIQNAFDFITGTVMCSKIVDVNSKNLSLSPRLPRKRWCKWC